MTGDRSGTADRLKVLLIEDEVLVALVLEDTIEGLGHEIVATAGTVQHALDVVREKHLDLAILDVNVGGQQVFPVADLLSERGIPFCFVTGYGKRGLKEPYQDCPVLMKPFTEGQLAEMISRIVAPAPE